MCGVEQENITAGPETPITEQVSSVSQREERLADAERLIVCGGDPRVGLEIERIAHVLEPSEFVRCECLRRADRRFRGVAVHSVCGKMITAGQQRENSFDSLEIFAERSPRDFDLYMRVPVIEELANFISEPRDVIGRKVIAASGINRHDLPGGGFSDELAEKSVKRFFRDLGGRVPERHVQGSDRDTTLAVTAGVLALHHAVPGSKWVEVVAGSRDEFIFPGGKESRRKTLANQSALAKATDRREAEACDWRAVPMDIRNDGDHRRVETVGRNLRIAVARDWNRSLSYVYDPHLIDTLLPYRPEYENKFRRRLFLFIIRSFFAAVV